MSKKEYIRKLEYALRTTFEAWDRLSEMEGITGTMNMRNEEPTIRDLYNKISPPADNSDQTTERRKG